MDTSTARYSEKKVKKTGKQAADYMKIHQKMSNKP